MVPVNSAIKQNLQYINVIHLNILVGVVVESGNNDHSIWNPLTLTELRLQISIEATIQTPTKDRLVALKAMKRTLKLGHFIDLNIRVGVVVESGDSAHFFWNPLTLTELRLQISFEATVQTLTEVRLVVLKL